MKLFKQPQPDQQRHDYDLAEIQEAAAQARRLAIYDRETQLYAYWYLQMRAGEEISRAKRHGESVVCFSIWVSSPPLTDAVCARLRPGVRDEDLAAYLHNGHFVVLLTDTDAAGARVALHRLLAGLEDVTAATACFPEDGASFDELLECAKARASVAARASGSAG